MRAVRPLVAVIAFSIAAAAGPARSIVLERASEKAVAAPANASASPLRGRIAKIDVADGRHVEDPQVIGGQKERGKLLYAWRATNPVAPAVAESIRTALTRWGIRVDSGGALDAAFRLDEYRVDEISETFGSRYQASVKLHASLLDPAGGVLLERDVAGTAKKSGPDRRESLCNEVLTRALDDALAQFAASASVETSTPVAAPVAAAVAPATATAAPTAPTPPPTDKLLEELVRMKTAGVGDTVLVEYVRSNRPAQPLTADEIVRWKEKGLSDDVIRATYPH